MAGRQITRHTLRHTAITHLVQAGVDLATVQRVSGHKTFEMVFRYSHQNQPHVQDALSKLDQRITVGVRPQPEPVLDENDESDYTRITQIEKTSPINLEEAFDFVGRPCRDRTCDQRIKSPLLYQLS